MTTKNLRTMRWVMAAGLMAGCVIGAEMPAAPKMPQPAPNQGGGQQPTQDQLREMQREHERRNTKPRKGNEQEPFGGGEKKKDKEEDGKVSLTGIVELIPASTGTPESFSIKNAEGKGYTLDGKETTLRRLVGKSVELEGETDKKSGALKVKSVREAKAKAGDKKPEKKT